MSTPNREPMDKPITPIDGISVPTCKCGMFCGEFYYIAGTVCPNCKTKVEKRSK